MGSYQGHGSVAYPHGLPLTWAVMTQGGFQVNLDGYRFADEMRGYSEHAQEVIKQPGHLAWNIYDERCEKPALGFHDYREIVKLGAVKRANTIDELASLTDLPSKTLARTFEDVARYAAGEKPDPLGRDFTKQPPLRAAVPCREGKRRALPYTRRVGHRCAGASARAGWHAAAEPVRRGRRGARPLRPVLRGGTCPATASSRRRCSDVSPDFRQSG